MWTVHLRKRLRLLDVFAIAAVAIGWWALSRASVGLDVEQTSVAGIPVTVYRTASTTAAAPAVVIAHGFAGSRQLMQPLAETLAHAGYLAVTFDFAGHGRNPRPMEGGIGDLDRSTRLLLDEIGTVARFAKTLPGSDGHLALVGHSMASELVVQYAIQHPDVEAVVALSLFGRDVTPTQPRDLLVIDGAWEPGQIKDAGLRIVRAAADGDAREGVTYGDAAKGTGRRFVLAAGAEHIGVIYSHDALTETVAWMNTVFGRDGSGAIDSRGKWLALLFIGLVGIARPIARALPRISPELRGAALTWRRLAVLCIGPALLTPVLARLAPTDFLPILLGDYLAVHFAIYGLLTMAGLWGLGAGRPDPRLPRGRVLPLLGAAAVLACYHIVLIGLPIDAYVTSFAPTGRRWALIPVIFLGVAIYFLADEWLTRGARAPRGGHAFSKLCFVLSLAIAVALDPGRLFFLVIIVPVMAVLLTFHAIVNRWVYARVQEPAVGALGSAMGLAWAIAVTFPVVA